MCIDFRQGQQNLSREQWKIGQKRSWPSQSKTTCKVQENKQERENKNMVNRNPKTGRFTKAPRTQKKACACAKAKATKTTTKKAAPKAKKVVKKTTKKAK